MKSMHPIRTFSFSSISFSHLSSVSITGLMAYIKFFLFLFLAISSPFLLYAEPANSFHPLLPDIQMLRSYNIDKIYQLGDSLSDTGNRIRENPSDQCSKFPYGESFFKEPTGRCSDGLLMIDYIASAIGLPFLNPYKNVNANFSHGVNFAVGGATALSTYTLAEKDIILSGTNSSLGVQLDWMDTHFASLCKSDKGCGTEKLKNALFMVGEIGGNDYNFALLQGKTIKAIKSIVPEVIQAIMDAVRRVIDLGAIRVVVPGNIPFGCISASLTMFPRNNPTAYDKHHCLNDLNDVAMLHNEYLQKAIEALKEEYPNITIVYADYYNAFWFLLNNAPYLGFDVTSVFKACCGIGGSYNFDWTRRCGLISNIPSCSDPSRYINWDGVHLTQKAYMILAAWLVEDILPKLKL